MHKIEIPAWAIERGRAMNFFPTIDPGKTALIVVDLQNAFMVEGQPLANQHALDIIPNVNLLANGLRAAGAKIAWTRHTFVETVPFAPPAWQMTGGYRYPEALAALAPDTFGHALHDDLDVAPQDLVIDKYRYSAFIHNSSDLDAKLRGTGIDTIIVTGTVTNCCCESTARDGNMLNYKTFFISDATAALTDEEHNAALLSMATIFADVRSTEEMLGLLTPASIAA
ncbi:MAG: rutB 2 [Rhodospirillales bacterium]|nr:rutB 2 [Rhodospirillales bacterium]